MKKKVSILVALVMLLTTFAGTDICLWERAKSTGLCIS